MRVSHPLARWSRSLPAVVAVGASLAFVACSSSDDPTPAEPDTTAPTASSFVQNRGLDATGQTVSVTFSEAVTALTAEVTGSYTFSGGVNVTTATLRPSGMVVDLVLDALALPGTNSISIAAGIEDAAGNASAIVTAQPITSSDTTAPAGTSVAGTTIEGPENDTITVVFNDDMIESEVETLANWNIESPLGTPFDITGATVDYVPMTRTATVTLGAGSADQNLQTFDDIHANFITMRDLGANTITTTAIGTTAIMATVGGDTQAPTLTAAAPGTGNTVVLTFSEDVAGVETLDLQSGPNPTGTEITITDASDPGMAASGTIELTGTVVDGDSLTISDGVTAVTFEFDFAAGSVSLSGLPNDTDTVTISDGTTPTTFEFESAGGVGGGNIPVTIGVDAPATIVNLIAAVNGEAFTVTAGAGATANDVALTNDAVGAAGNVTISNVDIASVQTISGMAGGGITGDIAVAVDQSSDATTVTNLRAAIDAHIFNITTGNGGAATDFVVTNDAPGMAGNVMMSESDTNGVIAFVGMAGGTNAGTATFEPSASTASGTPLQAIATYSITPAATDTLRIYGVTDLAGNQMAPELAHAVIAASAAQPGLSLTNSTITADPGEDNDSMEIRFDMDVHPSGLTDPANYTLTDGSGSVDISNAAITQTATDRVMVDFNAVTGVNIQSAETYTIGVNNIRSLQGAQRTVADTESGIAPGGDVAAPSAGVGDAQLDPQTTNAVLVEFNEPVDPAGAVIGNYSISGNTTTAVAMVNPRVARVTFQNAPVLAETIDVAVAALTDLAGNAAGGMASIAITAADATAPTVTTAVGDTRAGVQHTIEITFDEAVDMTLATTPGNYAVSIVGGSAVSLTGATFLTDSSSNLFQITLPWGTYLDDGEMISVTTSNVTDVAGNAIVAAAVTGAISGDSTPPASATGFINDKEDPTGATVQVTFNEAMDAATTMTNGAWSGSGGQAATGVAMINPSTFMVTFDAAIGAAETIDCTTPTDVAMNAGSTITFNPAE